MHNRGIWERVRGLLAIVLSLVIVLEGPSWMVYADEGDTQEETPVETDALVGAGGEYVVSVAHSGLFIYVNGEKINSGYGSKEVTVSAGDTIRVEGQSFDGYNPESFVAWHVEKGLENSGFNVLCPDLLSDAQRHTVDITFQMPGYNLSFDTIDGKAATAYTTVTVEGTEISNYKAYDDEYIIWDESTITVPSNKVLYGYKVNGILDAEGEIVSRESNLCSVFFTEGNGASTTIEPNFISSYRETDFIEGAYTKTYAGGESIMISVAESENSINVNMKSKTSGWDVVATIWSQDSEVITFPGTGTWIAVGNPQYNEINCYEVTPITFGSANYPRVAVYAEEIGQGIGSAYVANDMSLNLKANIEAGEADTSEIWGWNGPVNGALSYNAIYHQEELDTAEFTVVYPENSYDIDLNSIYYRVQGADTKSSLNVYAIVSPVTTIVDDEIGNAISENTRMILYVLSEQEECYAIFGDQRIPLETLASPLKGRNTITTPAATSEEYGWIYRGIDADGNYLFEEGKPYSITHEGAIFENKGNTEDSIAYPGSQVILAPETAKEGYSWALFTKSGEVLTYDAANYLEMELDGAKVSFTMPEADVVAKYLPVLTRADIEKGVNTLTLSSGTQMILDGGFSGNSITFQKKTSDFITTVDAYPSGRMILNVPDTVGVWYQASFLNDTDSLGRATFYYRDAVLTVTGATSGGKALTEVNTYLGEKFALTADAGEPGADLVSWMELDVEYPVSKMNSTSAPFSVVDGVVYYTVSNVASEITVKPVYKSKYTVTVDGEVVGTYYTGDKVEVTLPKTAPTAHYAGIQRVDAYSDYTISTDDEVNFYFTMPEHDVSFKFVFAEETFNVVVDGVVLGKYAPGATVTLEPVSTAYKVFKGWKVTAGEVTIISNQFTMPSSDVEITGEYDIYDSSFGVGSALRLAKGVPYKFGSGKYKVSGDVSTYMGGMTFYVSSAGEYTFTEE